MKVVVFCGTRPEAIKLIPVYLEYLKRGEVEVELWSSGQHDEMFSQVTEVFSVQETRNLRVMTFDQGLADLTAATLSKLQLALSEAKPDLMIVQGDTSTAFVGALAAFYNQIPVAHVEAGLRTNNRYSPFPEEMNRCLISQLTNYHFAPTAGARTSLLKEGFSDEHIWVTGNTVIDALDIVVQKVRRAQPPMPKDFNTEVFNSSKSVLITGHRRENFGEGFKSLCLALKTLAKDFPDYSFFYPVHLNPNVQEVVFESLGEIENVYLTEPLSYEQFVWTLDNSYLIISDSGGVQEEAPHLGKPVLVTRDTTERPEAIDSGVAKLVGTNADKIYKEASLLIKEPEVYEKMSKAQNPYGDGKAAERIVDVLMEF